MNGRKNGVNLADHSLQPMGFVLRKQGTTPHQVLSIAEQQFIWVHTALSGHILSVTTWQNCCHQLWHLQTPQLRVAPGAETRTLLISWTVCPGRDCTMNTSLTLHHHHSRRNLCPQVSPGRFPRQYIYKDNLLVSASQTVWGDPMKITNWN